MYDEIGILEIRKINALLKDKYKYDFSTRATTFYKRRLRYIVDKYKLKSFDSLVDKLENDLNYLDAFLFDMTVPVTEMFRDPSLWRVMRKKVIDNVKNQMSFKIWMPECSTGEELYSLCIFLEEEGLRDSVKVYASSASISMINFVKRGVYKLRREDVNSANYERAKCKKQLSNYFSESNGSVVMNTDLLSNVEFSRVESFENADVKAVKLVFFRNNLIYYNKTYQNDLINTMWNVLLPGGYLVIGNKENLNCLEPDKKFRVFDGTEKIFQKL